MVVRGGGVVVVVDEEEVVVLVAVVAWASDWLEQMGSTKRIFFLPPKEDHNLTRVGLLFLFLTS